MKRIAFVFDAGSQIAPDWHSSSGENGGVRYFVRRLIDVIAKYTPQSVAVAFDGEKPYWRNQFLPSYKEGRHEKDEDLSRQIRLCSDLLRLSGLDVLEVPGMEADDLVASYAIQKASKFDGIVICSNDKDCNQILRQGKITIAKKIRVNGVGAERDIAVQWYSAKHLWDEYGVTPDQWIDFQCMVGDKADNIAGAHGIGNQIAKKVMRIWGTLDKAIENSSSIGLGQAVAASIRELSDRLDVVRKVLTLDQGVLVKSLSHRDDKAFMKLFKESNLSSRGDEQVLLRNLSA